MPARTISLLALLLLAACGGSGSETRKSSPAVAPNQPPLAQAQVTGPVAEGMVVTLEASASTDTDGYILSYAWAQTAGLRVVLESARSATATFAAPSVTGETTLTFALTVTDDAGATDVDYLEVVVDPLTYTVSGTITAVPGSAVDGDVNDSGALRVSNDSPPQAQSIVSPVNVSGYVNVAGAGPAGALQPGGDARDFYRVDLQAGATVALHVADPERGDPDLYLWDAAGATMLDASLDTGALEKLTVASGGEYLLEVTAYSGATNYTLVVGRSELSGAAGGLTVSGDFVPGDVILEWRADRARMASVQSRTGTMFELGLRASSDGAGLPVLARVAATGTAGAATGSAAGDHGSRFEAIATEANRRKYETLLAIKALSRDASVRYAQPNFRVRPQAIPGDPLYPLQWHYPMIDLPAAWEFTRGDAGVSVAVVDTGVLLGHPDLSGRLLPGFDFVRSAENGADGDGVDADPSDPGDGEGQGPSAFHGTHVAGTVAAVASNGIGVSGVAPGVKLLPVRSLGVQGGSSYDIVQGVRYAAGLVNDSGAIRKPVDVINLSLGRSGGCWPAEQAAFDAARAAGVVLVAAAGNDSQDAANAFPASCEGVIAVGAVDRSGSRAPYSNFGSSVDVQAPGGDAEDRDGDGYPDAVLSLKGDDTGEPVAFTYGFKKGTSMASPHVAGVIALMKSVNGALTPDQIDQLLVDGALTDSGGIINAYRAVSAALNAGDAPPETTAVLAVSPGILNFAAAYNYAEFEVRTSAAADLQAGVPVSTASWLTVAPIDANDDNLGRYAVTVDRAGMAPGSYDGALTITSSDQAVEIPVAMEVTQTSAAADAGRLYVLLVSEISGEVVRQVAVTSSGGRYAYEFNDVDDGRYRLLAGSDSDNDRAICDAGETCGGHWHPAGDAALIVDAHTPEVDFSVGPVVVIPGQTSQRDWGAARAAGDTPYAVGKSTAGY